LFILVTMNSSGGIVLASQDGKIVCDNTLDARLNVSFRQKLPEVRGDLISLLQSTLV
jgi:V-type H+-transporting ATPase subunit E